ncbi:MAG TPA: hypothetical protein PKI03_26815, partial [Pseudomonadota bacterium]|nr:hypothetical protein [Pseudomonadota bacterium]
MTRLRWLLGALIAAVSLVAASLALRTYITHGLWLGGLAVVVLALIAAVGFASLAHARLRLWRELAALSQTPAGGELLTQRRAELEAIQQSGTRPDLDALAAATAATELGRAYLGKYLVAVTVLVGLVGTFAGLMETLRGVAPLLADEQMTTLRALSGPLAGLDVTFGASLVGILVTLSLALVQGDLALAEEATLARLEERTRHLLLPALWPTRENTDERTLAEMTALRAELTDFLVRTSAAAAEKVAAVAKQEVDRMVSQVQHSVAESVQSTAGRVETGLMSLAQQVESRLTPIFSAQQAQLTSLQRSAEGACQAVVTAGADAASKIATAAERTEALVESTMKDLQATQANLLREAGTVVQDLATATLQSTEQLQAALQGLGEAQTTAASALLQGHTDQCQRLDRTLHSLAEQHAQGAATLLATQAAQAEKIDATLLALGDKQATAAAQVFQAQAAHAEKIDATLLALGDKQAAAAAQVFQAQAAQAEKIDATLLALGDKQAAAAAQVFQAQAAQAEKIDTTLLGLGQTQAEGMAQIFHSQAAQAEKIAATLLALAERQQASNAELSSIQAGQTKELSATLAGLGQTQAQALDRLRAEIASVSAGLLAAQKTTSDGLLAAQATAQEQLLSAQAQAQTTLLAAQAEATQQRSASDAQLSGQLAQTLAALGERQLAHSQQLQSAAAEASQRRVEALQGLHTSQIEILTQTTAALCQRIEASVGGEGLRLAEAAQALQATSSELQAATA